ncbi:XK-related protein 8 [Oryzias melastigma]|uniref:XK-related protein n=1 Tax=Oryzias melastigma TaxID=30732 RepID=A0A3B3BH61_ORYME|nr:XK-related protein 8 [Oryzias melastigma]
MAVFVFSPVDFLFSCFGLPLFITDVVLDVLAVVNFYQERAWVRLSVLLLLLVGSSVLTQIYSWKWYTEDGLILKTRVEGVLEKALKTLHVLQLGIYVRHLGVLEMSTLGCCCQDLDSNDVAVELSHDLCMLRLIEAFSESAPQIVLWLTIILQDGELDFITVLKVLCSVGAVAFCVTTYHRSLRSFVKDTTQLTIISSIIYFLWNLLLLISRLMALALFASVLPCFIFAHCICSWMVFVLFAWRAKTDFMDNDPCGERLYRATVGLIWYFDWFNVVKGKTKKSAMLYHSFILLDICMLCGLWYWTMNTQPPQFVIPWPYAEATAGGVVGLYILGLLVKIIYYKFFHPKLSRDDLRRDQDEVDGNILMRASVPDLTPAPLSGLYQPESIAMRAFPPAAPPLTQHGNKRMRKLAENFYS